MYAKYIMLNGDTPVVFPHTILHCEICPDPKYWEITSAGTMDLVVANGRIIASMGRGSTTLGLPIAPNDKWIIEQYLNKETPNV